MQRQPTTTRDCRCCGKQGQFCRCNWSIHEECGKCLYHCECKRPVIDGPAGDRAICKGPNCGAVIFWVRTKNGKRMPLDASGQPHWATCPDSKVYKRKKVAC